MTGGWQLFWRIARTWQGEANTCVGKIVYGRHTTGRLYDTWDMNNWEIYLSSFVSTIEHTQRLLLLRRHQSYKPPHTYIRMNAHSIPNCQGPICTSLLKNLQSLLWRRHGSITLKFPTKRNLFSGVTVLKVAVVVEKCCADQHKVRIETGLTSPSSYTTCGYYMKWAIPCVQSHGLEAFKDQRKLLWKVFFKCRVYNRAGENWHNRFSATEEVIQIVNAGETFVRQGWRGCWWPLD